MSGSGGGDGENRATGSARSRAAWSLARLGCPVIALSQLNRSVMETRRQNGDDKRCASRRHRAGRRRDHVHLPTRTPRGSLQGAGRNRDHHRQQRNGPTGTCKLTFMKPLTKFDNLAPGVGDSDY